MNQEMAFYEQELCWALEHLYHTVDGLPEQHLSWSPDLAQVNSSAAILAHMLARTRVARPGEHMGKQFHGIAPPNLHLRACLFPL